MLKNLSRNLWISAKISQPNNSIRYAKVTNSASFLYNKPIYYFCAAPRFISLIEEYQYLEHIWTKYDKGGEKDEDFINGLLNEPGIKAEVLDNMKKLRSETTENIKLGNSKEAIVAAKQYKDIVSEYYPDEHPATLSAMNNIAVILKSNNELEEAKSILYNVFCSYLKVFGSEHMSVITSLQNLARIYVEQKNHDIAVKLFKKVIDLRTNESINSDEIEIILCKSHLAGCYRELGVFDKCFETQNDAVKDFEEVFDNEDNLIKAHLLNNKGISHKKQGDFGESEVNYQKCQEIREKNLDENHPEIVAIKHNLSEQYFVMGNKEKSAEFANDVMKHMEGRESK